MLEKKPSRISDVVSLHAPEGFNDRKWFLAEHQLAQVKLSSQAALSALLEIQGLPENEQEGQIAEDCYEIIRGMCLDIQAKYATFLAYISGTDVPERISRKEL